ncbi:protein translocase subunit SecF [Jongsikchunia kroppenstedtii]|uniref:protein translocase subunit SecF n=1 Tax=Jongsikchunia kroppenstedtii TaxID=1121721 RepID=UPI0005BAE482|nr:protein translocase subunit SecF [Jongsikchunia kroppenstedtii]
MARTEAPMSDADFVASEGHSLLSRLYTGTGAFAIVANRRRWYAITAAILVVCALGMGIRGFNLGIEFEGGSQISLPANSVGSTTDVKNAFSDVMGESAESVQTVGSGDAKTVQIRTSTLSADETVKLKNGLVQHFSSDGLTLEKVSSSDISSSWGGEVTKKMLIALAVFLAIVLVYITIRFDREMAFASLASLIFDVGCTAGVYALLGLEVTPATVVGLLTILGFSIYDTVVVFDKVEENTRGVLNTTRRTYAEQANLGINQTLMRSINTTVISVLPILSLMVVAVWLLGIGTLKDLGVIQLVGVVVGAYSSIFLAAPLLVTLKERRPEIKAHTAKVLARRARTAGTDDTDSAGDTAVDTDSLTALRSTAAPKPGARPAGKRRRRR